MTWCSSSRVEASWLCVPMPTWNATVHLHRVSLHLKLEFFLFSGSISERTANTSWIDHFKLTKASIESNCPANQILVSVGEHVVTQGCFCPQYIKSLVLFSSNLQLNTLFFHLRQHIDWKRYCRSVVIQLSGSSLQEGSSNSRSTIRRRFFVENNQSESQTAISASSWASNKPDRMQSNFHSQIPIAVTLCTTNSFSCGLPLLWPLLGSEIFSPLEVEMAELDTSIRWWVGTI